MNIDDPGSCRGSEAAQTLWLHFSEAMARLTIGVQEVCPLEELKQLVIQFRDSAHAFVELDPEGAACEAPVREIKQLLTIAHNLISK